MDFEGLETSRKEYIDRAFKAMASIAESEAAPYEHRIMAAKVMDSMSDTIVKAFLTTKVTDLHEDVHKNSLKSKLDQLDE